MDTPLHSSNALPRGDVSRGIQRVVNHTPVPGTPMRNVDWSDDSSVMNTPMSQHSLRVLAHNTPGNNRYEFENSSSQHGSGGASNIETFGAGGNEAYIWGTSINVNHSMNAFRNFLDLFTLDESDIEPYYHRQLSILHRTGGNVLNMHCRHLYAYPAARALYRQLIQYPQEIIPIMDAVINEEYRRIATSDFDSVQRIRVCVFGLMETKRMRGLDPVHIDTLISIKVLKMRFHVFVAILIVITPFLFMLS